MPADLKLSPASRRAFERVAADGRRILGDRLVAVIATDATASVIFATEFQAGDIDAFGALVESWHREHLSTPLLLTGDEFRRSLDTFPIEYQAMIDRHALIAGTPPFDGVAVPADQLRRGCEVQAKGHLIHLRQGWLEAAGHDHKLGELLISSSTPLAALLTNVARLTGSQALALEGARNAGLPEALIASVLDLEGNPERAHDLIREMPAYLRAAERLWAFVDSWPASR